MSGASALPMTVEPVAETSGSRGSSASWRARSAPPMTTSSSPSGASPNAAAARRSSDWQASAVSGVRSLGFHTTGSPHTSASAEFQLHTATGKLKALITPTGPSGCQVSSMRCPGRSDAIVRPNSCRERPTARSQMSIISWTSPRPSCAILPVSSVTSAPSASFSRRSSSPNRRASSPRRGSRDVAPLLEGGRRPRDRGVRAGGVGAGDVRERLARDRRAHLEVAAARALRSRPSRSRMSSIARMGHLRRSAGGGRATRSCHARLRYAGASADVAQLARASPCHGEGRGFEPLHPLPGTQSRAGARYLAGGRRRRLGLRDAHRRGPRGNRRERARLPGRRHARG